MRLLGGKLLRDADVVWSTVRVYPIRNGCQVESNNFSCCFDIRLRSCNRLVFREGPPGRRKGGKLGRIDQPDSDATPLSPLFLGKVSLQLRMQGRSSGRKEAARLRVALQVRGNISCPSRFCPILLKVRLGTAWGFIQSAYV